MNREVATSNFSVLLLNTKIVWRILAKLSDWKKQLPFPEVSRTLSRCLLMNSPCLHTLRSHDQVSSTTGHGAGWEWSQWPWEHVSTAAPRSSTHSTPVQCHPRPQLEITPHTLTSPSQTQPQIISTYNRIETSEMILWRAKSLKVSLKNKPFSDVSYSSKISLCCQ